MATETSNQVDARWTDRASMDECAAKAVQRAMKLHKAMDVAAVVERGGKLVKIPPEEIVIEDRTAK